MPKVTIRPERAACVRLRDRCEEAGLVEDEMVGGQHDHARARMARFNEGGCGGDGRSGIATGGFEQQRALHAHLHQLAGDEEAEIGMGDDDRLGKHRPLHPRQRLLEHRFFAEQRDELLGEGFARGRPEARARSTADDDGNDQLCRGHALLTG